MSDANRFHLMHGPYHPPAVNIDDSLSCERYGPAVVIGFSEGRIPWPLSSHGKGCQPWLILCGDLARAVRCESNQAVAHWWGVRPSTVSRYRQALGVPRANEGSIRLLNVYLRDKLPLELVREGVAIAHGAPAVEARMDRARQRGFHRKDRPPWPAEHMSLLGTMPDREVAERLGRKHEAISQYRRKMGIPAFGFKHPAAVKAQQKKALPLSADKLAARRVELGLLKREAAERAGMGPLNYIHYESRPRRWVRPETLARLARALDCPPESLLREEPTE